jgi:hypothetical protein
MTDGDPELGGGPMEPGGEEVPELTPQGEVLLRWAPAGILAFSALAALLFRLAGLSWPATIVVFLLFAAGMLARFFLDQHKESRGPR